MNILPIALIFLAILTTLSYNFLKDSKTLSQEKELCLGYLQAERLLTNTLHQKAYRKAKEKKTTEIVINSEKTQGERKSTRQKSFSKMNLYPLFTNTPSKQLKEIFEKTLTTLYGSHPSFAFLSDPQEMKTFISLVLESGKEKIKDQKIKNDSLNGISLSDFYPQNPNYAPYFYKMLKGTHLYKINGSSRPLSKGYPPLGDFFFFKEDPDSKLFCFATLSIPLLEIIFGEELTQSILKKETELSDINPQKKNITLSQNELLSLVHEKSPTSTHLDSIIELLDFQKKKIKKEKIQVVDTKTQITLERFQKN